MKITGIVLLALTACGLLSPFIMGLMSIPQGYMILLTPIVLLTPILACIGVAMLLKGRTKIARVSLSIVALLIPVGFLFVFPGAALWTLGFAANFRLTKHPAEIQTWAIDQIQAYHHGILNIDTNSEYWAVGREKICESSIPQNIRELWAQKPSIGIATMTRDGWLIDPKREHNSSINYGDTTSCVAISWYLHGFLIGKPDFEPSWNPWYMHRMGPGLYAFCGMK